MFSSLRLKLSLTVIGFTCILSIALVAFGYHRASHYRDDQQKARIQHLLNAINYSTERVTANHELIQIVNLFAAERDVRLIVLAIGDPLKVVASSRSKWLGKPISNLPADIGNSLRLIANSNSSLAIDLESNSGISNYGQRIVLAREEYGNTLLHGAILVQIDNANLNSSKQQAGLNILLRADFTKFRFRFQI